MFLLLNGCGLAAGKNGVTAGNGTTTDSTAGEEAAVAGSGTTADSAAGEEAAVAGSGTTADSAVADGNETAENAVMAGSAAAEGNEKAREKKKLSVVVTIFPAWDFIRQIGGEYVEAKLLLRPGMESHAFEPTPQDMIAVSQSDLFLYVGGESDAWVETLLSGTETGGDDASEGLNACRLMEFVRPREEEYVQGMQVKGHQYAEDETEYDEHIWTSPVNVMAIVQGLCDRLREMDPEHASVYEANTKTYLEQLEQLDASFRETVEQGKRKTIVFGDRFPFLYFVKEYGLEYAAAFPGCNAETEPNAATIAYLIDKVKEERIPAVFYLELSNHRVADALAESTGARALEFHSCHNVTKKEMEAGATYLSLMEKNRQVLETALQ